ncbi:hypothetical protein [Reinekea blandensis]|uniref:DUF4382 domain-containing protein n=1 Tax=Reinekea blandensis MED297 TaxID=314283 RepID=A4B9G8_9GAMM|nr:hypothetical protein [Reinekea blandensis]EAR11269.1 hypothetical protein MED297_20317 [Reinekea sp. MED297] [Reinekea blandensis MED297]
MKNTMSALALLPALALIGCNPNTLDGTGEVTLQFGASETSARTALRATTVSSIPVTDSSGQAAGSIGLNEAWVVVKEIELEHETDDDDALEEELEIEFVGPFAVDLLSGETYPSLPSVSIDTGLYNDIEIDIEKLADSDLVGMPDLPQAIADQLLNYSLYLEGTYTSQDGSTYVAIPFSLSYDQTDEFELSGTDFSQGFVVDDTGINDIIVAFRLHEWFRFDNLETNSDGLELVNAITSTEGGNALVLDGNTNSDLMDVIEDNIEESAEYGEDDDDDGELDEDEDDDDD